MQRDANGGGEKDEEVYLCTGCGSLEESSRQDSRRRLYFKVSEAMQAIRTRP
jgi:hypothetical protein